MTSKRRAPAKQSRVPAGRFERLARLGWLAGEVALGGLGEAARRFTGASEAASSVFMTATNARKLAEKLSRMRGAAMKLGQLLSLEGQDFLPPEVADALSVLRAEGDAMPEAQLRRVLARNYGKGWEQRFRTFGLQPIAAASIGQVHHAIALDGRELALKIQYPGVAVSIESDVDNLATILKLSRLLPGELDLSGVLAEAKRQLRQETDYAIEARHLRAYADKLGAEPGVVIPRVHDDLTTRHILAMDYLEGAPLDALAGPGHTQKQRDRIGALLYRILFRELFELRFMQTDPNFANYLLLPSGDIGLLDYGAVRELPAGLVARYVQLFDAGMRGDRAAMRAAMLAIGFFDADERADRVEGLLDLFSLGFEPFAHRGAYDFGRSDIMPRAREVGMALTLGKGFLRPPPPETIFLHRKLGGTFLLCNRIGARADVRALLRPFVEPQRAAG
ncbi:MAG: AarF/ABC1/UbiB kinase family protein [Deltaproteobacteria bacterium]|nr:AarF/ABC1/UbiB kinase family protein [Deltaproteobacteria bacterium]